MLHMISIICVLVPLAMTGPTIYKLDKEENTAERVMVPVSSTGEIILKSRNREVMVAFLFVFMTNFTVVLLPMIINIFLCASDPP